jgi:hypothetical protein
MSVQHQTEVGKRSLNSIVSEMLAVIDDAGGEVTARVDELGLELDDKVQAYRAVMLQLEAEAEAFGSLIHAYTQRCHARANQITALKFRLEQAMQAVGVEKIKTKTCTAYFQESKAVHIADEAAFVASAEDRFVVVKTTPHKNEIKRALEAGEAVEGAEIKTSRSLRFR